MTPVEGIAKLGFRKWYERQLIEGHAWFVTCFLCMLAVAAVLEELSFRAPLAQVLAYGTFVFGAGALGAYALLRYQRIMGRAERLGDAATCAACGTYGRFTVLSGSTVTCRNCAHRWNLVA